jgi:hypothetical protein
MVTLPVHIVDKVLDYANLDIDTKRALKILPKRLDEAKCWRLWYLLKSHDGIMYNIETKSLHIFRFPGYHIVKRPIDLDYHTAGLWVFNDSEEDYMTEITCPCGCFYSVPTTEAWVSEARILWRGARPTRELTTSDAMRLSH